MANEVRIPVRLEILQDSISGLQKILNSLQPNTTNFKAVERIINQMTQEAQKLQASLSKPFNSEGQFRSTNKTIDKLEESAARIQAIMGEIKFSDLKLTSDQQASFDQLNNKITEIRTNYQDFLQKIKEGVVSNSANKQLVDNLFGSAGTLKASFDDIRNAVEKHVSDLESAAQKERAAYEQMKSNAELASRANILTSMDGGITRKSIGDALFDKYFNETKAGSGIASSFKVIPGLTKESFLKELEEAFKLDPGTLNDLVGKTFKEINATFQSYGKSSANPFKGIMSAFGSNSYAKNTTLASDNLKSLEAELNEYKRLYSELETLQAKKINPMDISANAEIKSLQGQLSNLEDQILKTATAGQQMRTPFNQMAAGCSQLRTALEQANVQFIQMQRTTQFFNQMKMAIVNFMGFNQVLNLTKKAVREALNHIKELDTVMNRISIVTNMSTGDLWGQIDQYSKMAQSYGTTIKGAYEVSQIYYQQGLETADVLTLTNETLKLAKISGLDYAQTTDYMTTALRGFKMEMSEASTVVDVYSNLAAHTAVSQEELAVAMSKTASSMESVGSSFEESSAMIATMVAVTRESATNIGSALKSIASRYGELKTDPTKMIDAEGEVMSFNKVDAALQSVGISLKTADGQFRNFTDVIIELGEQWDQLDSTQQRYIATQFAGNRQQSRFLALVSNVDLLKSNLNYAEDSEDVGTLQALKALDSIESKMNQVQVAYQQFYTTMGLEGVWKGLLDGATDVITTLNNLPKLFGKIPVGAIAMIGDIVSIIKSVGTSLVASIANMWKQIMSSSDASTMGVTTGESFVQGIKSGISSGAKEIKAFWNTLRGKDLSDVIKPATTESTVKKESTPSEKENSVRPPLDFDTKPGEATYQSTKEKIESNPPTITTQADNTEVEAKLEQTQAKVQEIASTPIESQIVVNDSTITDMRSKIAAEIEGKPSEVKIDFNKAQEELNNIKSRLKELKVKGIDTSEAAAELDSLRQKAEALQKILGSKKTVGNENIVDAPSDKAISALRGDTTRTVAEAKGMQNAPVQEAQTQLTELQKKMEEIQKLPIELQVNDNSVQAVKVEAEELLNKIKNGEIVVSGEQAQGQLAELKAQAESFVSTLSNMSTPEGNFTAIKSNLDEIQLLEEKISNNDLTPKQAEQAFERIKVKLQETEQLMKSTFGADGASTETGRALEEQYKKAKTGAESLVQSNGKVTKSYKSLSGAAAGLNMLATFFNNGSEGGRIFSGVLMTVAGGLRAIDTVMTAISSSNPFGAILTGAMAIISVINGISTLVEDDAERLERLTKNAEEAGNKAKQAKADYKTLDNSVKKLDELKEKRYESAEAAEEYQEAVDKLAESFPAMVAGFDEAGNVILNTTNAEEILAEARRKSAQATYEAAQEEIKLAREQTKQARQTLSSNGITVNPKVTGSDLQSLRRSYVAGLNSKNNNTDMNVDFTQAQTALEAAVETWETYRKYIEQGLTDPAEADLIDEADQLVQNALRAARGFTFDEDKMDFKFNQSGEISVDNLKQYFAKLKELGYTLSESELEIYNLFVAGTEISIEDAKKTFNAAKENFNNVITNKDSSLDTIEKSYTELEKAYDNLRNTGLVDSDSLAALAKEMDTVYKNISTYKDTVVKFTGQEKIFAGAWQRYKLNSENGFSYIEKSTAGVSIVSQLISDNIPDNYEGTWEELEKTQETSWRIYARTMQDFIESLSPDELASFEKMYRDQGELYSAEDIIEEFNLSGIIKQGIESIYNPALESIQKRVKESFSKAGITDTEGWNLEKVDTTSEEKVLSHILQQYQQYIEQGLDDTAESYLSASKILFNSVENNISDVSLRGKVLEILSQSNLATREGLLAAAESIGILDDSKEIQSLKEDVETLASTTLSNIPLTIETLMSDYINQWKDSSSTFSKALTDGIEGYEIASIIDQAASVGVTLDATKDFQKQAGTKFTLDKNKWQEWYEASNKVLDVQIKSLDESIGSLEQITDANSLTRDILSQVGIHISKDADPTEYFNEFVEAVQKQKTNLLQLLFYKNTAESNIKLNERKTGDFSSLTSLAVEEGQKAIDRLLKLSKTEDFTDNELNDKNIIDTVKGIQSSVKTLISDIISKGIENINWDDYDYINQEDFGELSGTNEQITKKLLEHVKTTTSEANDLIVQAIQKDQELISTDLIKDFTFMDKSHVQTTLSGLKEFANKLGLTLDQISYEGNAALDSYILDLSQFKDINLDTDSMRATIQDSINNFQSNLVSLIQKGLSGSLSNIELGELQQFFDPEGIQQLDFTKTAEGIKLSEESFFSLYEKIDTIDSALAKKLLPELDKVSKKYSSLPAILKELEDSSVSAAKRLALLASVKSKSGDPESYKYFSGGKSLPGNILSYQNFLEDTYAGLNVISTMSKGNTGLSDVYNLLSLYADADVDIAGHNPLELLNNFTRFMQLDKDGKAIFDAAAFMKEYNIKTDDLVDGFNEASEKTRIVGESYEKWYNSFNAFSTISDKDWDNIFVNGQVHPIKLLQLAKNNEELKKALDNIQIGEQSLYEILNDPNLFNANKDKINILLQKMRETDWSWEELSNQAEQLARDAGMKITVNENGTFKFEFVADGEEPEVIYSTNDGMQFNSAQDRAKYLATKAMAESQGQDINEPITDENGNQIQNFTYKINGQTINFELIVDKEGNATFKYSARFAGAYFEAESEEGLKAAIRSWALTYNLSNPFNSEETINQPSTERISITFAGQEIVLDYSSDGGIKISEEGNENLSDEVRQKLQESIDKLQESTNAVDKPVDADVSTLNLHLVEGATINLNIDGEIKTSTPIDIVSADAQKLDIVSATEKIYSGDTKVNDIASLTANGNELKVTPATIIALIDGILPRLSGVFPEGSKYLGELTVALTSIAAQYSGEANTNGVFIDDFEYSDLVTATLLTLALMGENPEIASETINIGDDQLTLRETVNALVQYLSLSNNKDLDASFGENFTIEGKEFPLDETVKALISTLQLNGTDVDTEKGNITIAEGQNEIPIDKIIGIISSLLLQWLNGQQPEPEMKELNLKTEYPLPDATATQKINIKYEINDPKFKDLPNTSAGLKIESNDEAQYSQSDEYGKALEKGWNYTHIRIGDTQEDIAAFEQLSAAIQSYYDLLSQSSQYTLDPTILNNLLTLKNNLADGILDPTTSEEIKQFYDLLSQVLNLNTKNLSEIEIPIDESANQNLSEVNTQLDDLTGEHEAIIKETGAVQATNEVDGLVTSINSLSDKQIHITAHVADAGSTSAKGNVALAGGTPTLMGELGPELVVSNGRYFVVGQNGAEMINLAKDAIVFNHIQTRQLLNNGKTSRGKPVTNEQIAAGMATGNINGGPAKDEGDDPLFRRYRGQGGSNDYNTWLSSRDTWAKFFARQDATSTSGETKLSDKAISAITSAISTLVEGSIDDVKWDEIAKDLGADLTEELKDAAKSGHLKEFIHKYSDQLDKTMKEINELYFQAWQADLGASSESITSAVSGLTFMGGAIGGSSSDWTTLLSKYNIKAGDLVEAGIMEWDAALQQYIITDINKLKEIGLDLTESNPEFTAIIQDGMREFANNLADLLGQAISGSISSTDFQKLQSYLKANGMDQIASTDYTQTVEGIKISSEAAAHLYAQLSKIDSIAAKITFDKLAENLKESNENYKTTSSLLAHIKDLQDKIAKASKYDTTKINQYKEELALAQQILAVRATSEDESMNFLDQDIPGGFNNPLNYAQSWITAWKTLSEAASKGGAMDFKTLYNLAREMNSQAAQSGQSLNLLGQTLDGTATSLAQFAEAMASALSTDSDGNFGVVLSKLGTDLTAGADAYAGDADNALKTMAKAQIEILDGLIAFFEAIVAMEKFEKADENGNGLLDLNEIFKLDKQKKATKEFTSTFKKIAQDILDAAGDNSDLSKALKSIKFSGYSLEKLLKDAIDGTYNLKGLSQDTYQKIMSLVYEAYKKGDYNLDSIADSVLSVISANESGYKGTIDLGTMIIDVESKTKITKTSSGKWQYTDENGKTQETDDSEKALRMTILGNLGAKDIKWSEKTKTATGELTVDGQKVKVKSSSKGTKYTWDDAPSGYKKEYDSLDKLYEAMWKAAKEAGTTKAKTVEDWKVEVGVTATVKMSTDTSGIDPHKVIALVGKTWDDVLAEYNKDPEKFKVKYGFEPDKTKTASDWAEWLKSIGIEDKVYKLSMYIDQLNFSEDAWKTIQSLISGEAYTKIAPNSGAGTSKPKKNGVKDIDSSEETPKSETEDTGSDSDSGNGTSVDTKKLEAYKALLKEVQSIVIELSKAKIAVEADKKDVKDLNKLLKSVDEYTTKLANVLITVNTNGASGLQEIVELLEALNTKLDNIKDKANVSIAVSASEGGSSAKGNVALAAGRTLMGELGPELVVSNGRYFTVGNNGAEFVNLPKDAIVFNHLQTQQLLSNGHASRGVPAVSETAAVSMAAGNALASASETLATLKALRAMWQALADSSIQDLVKTATSTSDSSGGGNKEQIAAWLKSVERWYNWLQKIAAIEKEINKEEALRRKLESDRIKDGESYYQSQAKQLALLQQKANTQADLAREYAERFEFRRQELNDENSPMSQFYTYDEFGQLKYVEGGFAKLQAIMRQDDQGHTISPKEQYDLMLKTYGLGEYMKYDSEGKEITVQDGDWDTYYRNSVQAAWDRMEAEREEMQSLFDSSNDMQQKYLESLESANKILQAIVDNQIDLENKVVQAIENERQAEIDTLTKERQALSDSVNSYIKGLRNSLENERKLYSNQTSKDEITSLQRQIAILRRSGGSATQIASLEKELSNKQREEYFNKQEEQIKAIEDASNLELEKLQTQIDLMTETLAYEKEHGMLWNRVAEIMSGDSESIAAFITGNDTSWAEKSPLAKQEELDDILFSSEQWTEYRDNMNVVFADMGASITNGFDSVVTGLASTKEVLSNVQTHIDEVGRNIIDKLYNLSPQVIYTSTGDDTPSDSDNDDTTKSDEEKEKKTSYKTMASLQVKYVMDGKEVLVSLTSGTKEASTKKDAHKLARDAIHETIQGILKESGYEKGSLKYIKDGEEFSYTKWNDDVKGALEYHEFSRGGEVSYTGPAIVHGTPENPEYMLNADEYRTWKRHIVGDNSSSLMSQLSELQQMLNDTSRRTSTYSDDIMKALNGTLGQEVSIEHAEVSMHVEKIADDYDAQRAGEQALNKMLEIARKSAGNRVGR